MNISEKITSCVIILIMLVVVLLKLPPKSRLSIVLTSSLAGIALAGVINSSVEFEIVFGTSMACLFCAVIEKKKQSK